MVRVGHERLGSKQHGGGRRQAVGLKLIQWGREMSGWAQNDMVEAGDEQLRSN